jgi:hypothetical protein
VGAGKAAVKSSARIAAATTPGRSKPFKDMHHPGGVDPRRVPARRV